MIPRRAQYERSGNQVPYERTRIYPMAAGSSSRRCGRSTRRPRNRVITAPNQRRSVRCGACVITPRPWRTSRSRRTVTSWPGRPRVAASARASTSDWQRMFAQTCVAWAWPPGSMRPIGSSSRPVFGIDWGWTWAGRRPSLIRYGRRGETMPNTNPYLNPLWRMWIRGAFHGGAGALRDLDLDRSSDRRAA